MSLARLGPPAVIVVGEVAALHEQLSWFTPEYSRTFLEMEDIVGFAATTVNLAPVVRRVKPAA
jgi:hypothetical protein